MDVLKTERVLEFELLPADITAFALLTLRRNPVAATAATIRKIAALLALSLGVAAVVLFSSSRQGIAVACLMLALFCLWVSWFLSEARLVSEQTLASEGVGAVKQRIKFTEGQLIDLARVDGETRAHAWSDILELRETPDLLVLYLTTAGAPEDEAIIIPRRVTQSELKSEIEQRTGRRFQQ